MSTASDKLATRILLGMVLGILSGAIVRFLSPHLPGLATVSDWVVPQILEPFGRIFLRLLFFVIIPLIFASLTLGVSQLGRLDRLGPLAGRTFTFFFINMSIGVLLGLTVMNVLKPGTRLDSDTRARIEEQFSQDVAGHQERADNMRTQTTQRPLAWLVDTFMPANLFQAVVGTSRDRVGDVLPLILFALLIGAAATTLPEEKRVPLHSNLETIVELMTRIVGWALQLAPYAVAAMMASVVINLGLDFLKALSVFAIGILFAMAVHLFGTMSLLLRLFSRRSPRVVFRSIRTILVTAFSTSSSSATLPTSMAVTRQQLGVSAPTAGFVLPLGATMNMSGTALYEGCVVLFIAQVYGVNLSIFQELTLLLLAVLSAVAVAGIPGASLPLIMGLLANFGVPPEGIVLILGIDRLLDMARTTLNVGADVVTCVIVDEQMARIPTSTD
jgi:DAACS family dicarboxylate/amino acid:cation (Na+ or H+) symporter